MAPLLHSPSSPEEKLLVRMQQARVFGKEFDEEKERRVYGLPPAKGTPVFIPQSEQRNQLMRTEDLAGQRELEEMVQKQSATGIAERNRDLETENETLRRQIAELTGQDGNAAAPTPQPPKPMAVVKAAVDVPGGMPNKDWTRAQMLEFAKSRGLPAPFRQGVGMTNLAVLDFVLGELEKASPVTSVEA